MGLAESAFDLVRGLPGPLAVLIVAMMPVAELRGAIPLGVLGYRMPAAETFVYAFLGNLAPVPVILFALDPVSRLLRRHSRLLDTFFERLFTRTRTKYSWRFVRFRDFAVITFVAIPLPFTGAWTGSLAAFLFGVPARRAIPLVAVGIVIAGSIVTAIVLSGLSFFGIPHP